LLLKIFLALWISFSIPGTKQLSMEEGGSLGYPLQSKSQKKIGHEIAA
jgi:hypothetical protein